LFILGRITIFNKYSLIAIGILGGCVLSTCSKKPFSKPVLNIIEAQNNRQVAKISKQTYADPEVRYRLCLAAANGRDTTIVPNLSRFLLDSSQLVRIGAAFALGQLPCISSNALLTQRLNSESISEIRNQIVLSIGKVGGTQTLELLTDEDRPSVPQEILFRSFTYFFSRKCFTPEAIGMCIKALSSKNSQARHAAAVALQRISDPAILLPQIKGLLTAREGNDPIVQRALAKILKPLQFPEKNRVYLDLLSNPEWSVRYEAVQVIPSLPLTDSLWLTALGDSNPHVLAAVLESCPAAVRLTPSTIEILHNLFQKSSPHVRGSIIQLLYSKSDQNDEYIMENFPLTADYLLYKIEGVSKNLNRMNIEYLLPYIQYQKKNIATAAYTALSTSLTTLLENQVITNKEYKAFLQKGLTAADPVQNYLAANTIRQSEISVSELVPDLYACLKNQDDFNYLESILEVLAAIETIRPPDAPQYLKPLLTCRQKQLREESYRLLTCVYHLDLSQSPDYGESYLFASLKKLQEYGIHPEVRFNTSKGLFTIRCDGFYAPYTTSAFLNLVASGFYDGLTFHRVVPNFVVQGGDPRGDGWGGPGYRLLTEKTPLGYETGSVGMASAGPDTEGSQFFITTTPQYHLDCNYTRFGEIVEGMDVVLKIERGDRILSATILQASD
jgi:cyclophilin family peptidyl-prolyl cis-trans isomerase/HEAT repeat protein